MAEVEAQSTTGPGKYLAKRRSDRGLSKQEVADKLHLSLTIIKKIESDQYDEDLPDAFARGYLRNYAKLLELEQQEIIASYTQLIGQSKVKNYYEPSTTIQNPSSTGATANQLIILVVVLIALISVAIWFFSTETESTSNSGNSNPQQTEPVIEQPERIDLSADEPSSSLQDQQLTEVTPDLTSESLAVAQAETVPQFIDEPEQNSDIPTGFVESTEAVLAFDFEDDCWVQVTDVNDEVLAVGLKTAGRQFEVSGVAPIRVVLGKPNAVNIAYNNTEVDLACFPAGSTARFTLDSPTACEN